MPIISLIILISSIICLFINSWISIWIILEINTLAFCVLTNSFNSENSASEISMNYFIIQSISSATLLFSSIFLNNGNHFLSFLLIVSGIALAINMAASPFHYWFVSITNSLNWNNSTILMTWQNLAPVFLVLYQINSYFLLFTILSALIGSISQISTSNVIEIIAFSSIFNLSWIIFSLIISTNIFIIYLFIYWSTVIIIIILVSSSNLSSLNTQPTEQTNNWVYFLVLINLAGIPPIIGFLSNWLVLNESITLNSYLIITTLLTTSSINLYIYIRIINFTLINNAQTNQNENNHASNTLVMSFLFINTASYPLVII